MTNMVILLIISICGIAGGACLFVAIPRGENIKLYGTIGAICLIVYVSSSISILTSRTVLYSKFTNTYEIEEISPYFINIRFDGSPHSFDNAAVIVEKPNEIHENVVIEEEIVYNIDWIIDFRLNAMKYHVYMPEDIYESYMDRNVLWR